MTRAEPVGFFLGGGVFGHRARYWMYDVLRVVVRARGGVGQQRCEA